MPRTYRSIHAVMPPTLCLRLKILGLFVASAGQSFAQMPPAETARPLEAPAQAAPSKEQVAKVPAVEKQPPAEEVDVAKLVGQLSDKNKLTVQAAARGLGQVGAAAIPL